MEINYSEKINTFKLLIDYNDDDLALDFLERANWDEEKAANLYNKEMNSQKKQIPIKPPEPVRIPKKEEKLYDINGFPEIPMVNPHQGLSKTQKFFGFFDKLFSFSDKNNNPIFNKFEHVEENLETFYEKVSQKGQLGVVIIYSKETLVMVESIFDNIVKNSMEYDLFVKNKWIFPVINSTEEGNFFIRNGKVYSYPSMLICKKHPYKRSLAVLSKIKSITLDSFRDSLIKASEISVILDDPNMNHKNKVNKANNQSSVVSQYDNYELDQIAINELLDNDLYHNSQPLPKPHNNSNQRVNKNQSKNNKNHYQVSNADIIAAQKREMEELERQENEKKLEEQRKKEKELEEVRKRKEIEEQLKIESEIKKQTLPPEPDENDPNKTTIVFRYPDGSQSKERRFLKTDKVQLLYFFIESLGREIYTEDEATSFDLIQPFPFKVYNEKEKTLEEERLFPNAVLQIKENIPE